ncbi:TPA: hypothetical protein ACH3X2_006160 [Trebouxia sp. C0005]
MLGKAAPYWLAVGPDRLTCNNNASTVPYMQCRSVRPMQKLAGMDWVQLAAALDVLATAAILAAAAGKADRITAGRKATGDTR